MTITTTTPEAVEDGAGLLDEVRQALIRYVILPSPEALVGVVLWIAATHAVPAWAHAARLVIRAPEKRCGKSRLLDLVEALSHRPLMTVNASPSAVYRSIGMAKNDPPTLLLDEADTVFGKSAGEHEDLRGLLNAGHQRGRPAIRYDAAKQSVERIETFAMAALAGIGAMPDTIEDRALVIRMRRRAPGEFVRPYRVRRDAPALEQLRIRINAWARADLDRLAAAVPAMPVEDRAADTWEPLIAIADHAGSHWPDAARNAALVLTETRDEASDVSLRVRLLIDTRTAFAGLDRLPSGELVRRLRADQEAPWSDLGGTGLTVRRMSQLLREFDVAAANHRWEDGTQSKGYYRADFADAWDRYCPDPTTPKPGLDSGLGDSLGGACVPRVPSVPKAHNPRSEPYLPGTQEVAGTQLASQPNLASHPKTPSDQAKHPNWDAGTQRDANPTPTRLICRICHQAMTLDDPTGTHPGCDPEAGR
ncbi:MAG: DUF3631 domain-containing protein [Nocardioides sp.]